MKTHLTYKVDGNSTSTGAARCGNNNRNYKFGLTVVETKDFRNVDSVKRCAHCVDIYLVERNKIRRKKGLSPVSSAFEGQS